MNTTLADSRQNSGVSFALTANQLKTIAIICMLIDHIAHMFVVWDSPLGIVMHFMGRTTGPIMFFLAAAGYHYTRNVNKYMLRLAIFAVISYIPFNYCFNGVIIPKDLNEALNFNVIYTIFLGVLAIRVRRSDINNALKAFMILGIAILATFGDWGEMCIIIMLVFDFFYGDFKKQFWAYMGVIFMCGGLFSVVSYCVYSLQSGEMIDLEVLKSYISQLGMIVPGLLLSRYNGEKGAGGKIAKYGFYIFYPVHLLIIAILYYVVLKMG